MKKALTICFSLLAVGFLTGNALAYSQWKERPSVAQEFSNSAIVIVGKVLKATDVMGSWGVKGTLYTVQVVELFKGAPSSRVEFYSENSSGRFPMQVGVSYLLFGNKGVYEGVQREYLGVDYGGNSGPLKESEQSLAILRNQHHQIAEANSDGGIVKVVVGMFILVLCISTFNSLRSGVVDGFKGAKAKRDDAPTLYWGFIALHIVFIALLVRFLLTCSF